MESLIWPPEDMMPAFRNALIRARTRLSPTRRHTRSRIALCDSSSKHGPDVQALPRIADRRDTRLARPRPVGLPGAPAYDAAAGHLVGHRHGRADRPAPRRPWPDPGQRAGRRLPQRRRVGADNRVLHVAGAGYSTPHPGRHRRCDRLPRRPTTRRDVGTPAGDRRRTSSGSRLSVGRRGGPGRTWIRANLDPLRIGGVIVAAIVALLLSSWASLLVVLILLAPYEILVTFLAQGGPPVATAEPGAPEPRTVMLPGPRRDEEEETDVALPTEPEQTRPAT